MRKVYYRIIIELFINFKLFQLIAKPCFVYYLKTIIILFLCRITIHCNSTLLQIFPCLQMKFFLYYLDQKFVDNLRYRWQSDEITYSLIDRDPLASFLQL